MNSASSSSSSCCTPQRKAGDAAPLPSAQPIRNSGQHARNCVPVPGGRAIVGTKNPLIADDGEGPLVHQRVRDLWWERGAISIGQFRRFVEDTGYVTLAERYGWSFVFHSHVPGGAEGTLGIDGLEWWRRIDGATWDRPVGPEGPPGEDDLPATHIAHPDAVAFASWAGGRLPSEAEWEHAARGGLGDVRYPWGDEEPDDIACFPCNIWQGRFPNRNTAMDGYEGAAPVTSFAANAHGLHHMVGNVWEWTAAPFRLRSSTSAARRKNQQLKGQYLLKGGSFLCHRSYCHRYRIAARTGNTPDSTSEHAGFRVVYDQPPQPDRPG